MKINLKSLVRDGISLILIVGIAIWLGTQIPTWYKQFKGPFREGDFSKHIQTQAYPLTLYGTTTCPHCKTAREFLSAAGIPYNDLVIDQSPAAKEAFKSLGENGVPVLLTSNKLFVGFHKETYRKLAESVTPEAKLISKASEQ